MKVLLEGKVLALQTGEYNGVKFGKALIYVDGAADIVNVKMTLDEMAKFSLKEGAIFRNNVNVSSYMDKQGIARLSVKVIA